MKKISSINFNKFSGFDIPFWAYYLIGAIAIAAKLVLTSFQLLDLHLPAPIDDGLMFEAARALTQGEWLGDYHYLTISKHMAFALWSALLHLLGIPILVGNQILIAAVCMVVTATLSPIVTKYWQRLLIFGFTFYNPTATAAFTLRPYRDSIFPWVCLCVFACFIAVALRIKSPPKKSVPFLILGGLSLGFAYLMREDGYWVLVFTVAASIITAVYIFFQLDVKKRLFSLIRLSIPYIIMIACILAYSTMNYIHYGRFVVSDFTSREFASAIGAMTRVDGGEEGSWWSDEKISITGAARNLIYENVPEFAMLEEWLEGDAFFNAYGYVQTNDTTQERYIDYTSGGFYWALRRAADLEGIYDDPIKAKNYWENLAYEINRLCDDGTLPSDSGRRVSTMPPISSDYILPVIEEALHSFWFVLSYRDTYCYVDSSLSTGDPDDIEPMEDFFYTSCNIAAVEGEATPYYHPIWLKAYNLMDTIRLIYVYLLTPLFAICLVIQFLRGIKLFKNIKNLKPNTELLLWLIALGVILMAIFRIFIIAYVTVASFSIGTYIMYLGSVHPLIILYVCLTLVSTKNNLQADQKIV